jgi:hypothetical protein
MDPSGSSRARWMLDRLAWFVQRTGDGFTDRWEGRYAGDEAAVTELESDLRYLNEGLIGQLWPFAAEFIRTQVVHDAWHDVADIRIGNVSVARLHRSRSDIDLEAPPRVDESGPGALLTLRFSQRPGVPYEFRGRVHPRGAQLPGVYLRVVVTFAMAVNIARDHARPSEPGVRVRTNFRGRPVSALLKAFGADWKAETREQVEDRIGDHFGFIASSSYDPPDLANLLRPVLVHPDLPDDPPSAINLVFVADRFDDADQLRVFDQIVETFRRLLTQPEEDGSTEPFHSFKTALRLWTLDLSGDATRAVVERTDDPTSQRPRAGLGNLGRLARVGRLADELGPNVVLYLAHADALGGETRAMAMGNLVLLPTHTNPDDDDAAKASAYLVLHELGHTILGDLADEYFDEVDKDDPNVERRDWDYKGPLRLAAGNLAVPEPPQSSIGRPHIPFPDWHGWMQDDVQLPAWDQHPVRGVEGGGYFMKGLWRPAERCKMRHPRSAVPFCAVCREAISRKLRGFLGDDWFLLRIAYPERDEEPHLAYLTAARRGATLVQRVRGPRGTTTPIDVTLLAGSLPEPWELRDRFDGVGQVTRDGDHTGRAGLLSSLQTWHVPASFGDTFELQVRSTNPFTPQDPLPDYLVEVRFDRPLLDGAAGSPDVPTDLRVTNTTGAGFHVTLQATTASASGEDVRLEFEVAPLQVGLRGRVDATSPWIAWREGPLRGTARHRLEPDGAYVCQARAVDRAGRRSTWSPEHRFTVQRGGPGGGDRHDPHPPVDGPGGGRQPV